MSTDRTLIWLCVSSDEQAGPRYTSLDTQLERCQHQAQADNDTIVGVLRPPSEQGFSRFYSRIDQMMAAYEPYRQLVEQIEAGTCTRVLALNYSRLWRTAALATQLAAIAEEHDVWLASCEEPTTREGWMGNAWLRMIHSVQPEEQVRKLAADRRRGMRGRAEKGWPVESSQRPYGYRIEGRDKLRRLIVVEEERFAVQWVMRRRAEGWGYNHIAEEVEALGYRNPKRADGRWTTRLVQYIVHNPLYAGYVRFREWPRRPKAPRRGPGIHHVHQGEHEPIITEELWQAVQRVNESRAREYHREGRPDRLYIGLVRCGLCGDAMTYRPLRKPGTYSLACGRYRRNGGPRSKSKPESCQHNGYSLVLLHRYVLDFLRVALEDPVTWARQCEGPDEQARREAEIARLQREAAGIEARRANLLDAIETARAGQDRAQFITRYDALGDRRDICLRKVAELRQVGERIEQMQRQLESWSDVAGELETWTDAELRPLLLQLVDRIVLVHGQPPTIILAGQR